MKVILDTSVAIKEGYLRSASARTFLKAAKLLGIYVCLPGVAYDELLGRAKIEINERVMSANKANRKLTNLIGNQVPPMGPIRAYSKYEDWLSECLHQYDVEILEYPEISFKELVQASYARRKPFKESGEGFKDFVIWRTLLNLTENEPNGEFVFVTGNTRDYCEKNSDRKNLLPELADQLSKIVKLRVITDLALLFDEVMAPKLEKAKIEDIPENIEETAKRTVKDLLTDYTATGFEGLPLQGESTISLVEDVQLDPPAFKVLGDDEILVKFHGCIHAEFSGFMEKSEYYINDYELEINVWDSDWNDWVMLVSISDKLTFELELILEKASNKITGRKIELPTEVCFYDY